MLSERLGSWCVLGVVHMPMGIAESAAGRDIAGCVPSAVLLSLKVFSGAEILFGLLRTDIVLAGEVIDTA